MEKKMWTIEVQDDSSGKYNASDIYPLINGAKRGPGVYEVNDGDTITLYAKGNAYETAYAVIKVNGTKVASASRGKITSYAYKVNSNCTIRVHRLTSGSAISVGLMDTYLTTL